MGAAGNLGPDQGGLRMEYVRIDLFQSIPAQVVVAVAGGGCEAGGGNPIFPHGVQDLCLVVFRNGINGRKALFETLQRLFSIGIDSGRNAHFHIHIDEFFHKIHAFSYFFRHLEHYTKISGECQ